MKRRVLAAVLASAVVAGNMSVAIYGAELPVIKEGNGYVVYGGQGIESLQEALEEIGTYLGGGSGFCTEDASTDIAGTEIVGIEIAEQPGWPDTGDLCAGISEVQRPEGEVPGNLDSENAGEHTPDLGNEEAENPGMQSPGEQSPAIDVPGNSGEENPGAQSPVEQSPATDVSGNSGEENPGGQEPDTSNTELETQKPGEIAPDDSGMENSDTSNGSNSSEEIHEFASQVIDLVNQERAKAGLSELNIDMNITEAANVRAKEIKQSFSHTRPDGTSFTTVLGEYGVSYRGSGENIAWGQKSPEQVMSAWMSSDGHRANILNKNFKNIGVGYYQDDKGVNYWVQLFTY